MGTQMNPRECTVVNVKRWTSLLQLRVRVSDLVVSEEFLVDHCGIPQDEARLLLCSAVAFIVVAESDDDERAVVVRMPAYWTICAIAGQTSQTWLLTALPGSSQTLHELFKGGADSEFIAGAVAWARSRGHKLDDAAVALAVRWGHGAPSLLAQRSVLSRHPVLKSNFKLGKRVWIAFRALIARITRADRFLIAALAGYDHTWQTKISTYLLAAKRPLRAIRLKAFMDEPIAVAAAAVNTFPERQRIGNLLLIEVDRRGTSTRALALGYLNCTRREIRFLKRVVGAEFSKLSTTEIEAVMMAARLEPNVQPISWRELKAVLSEIADLLAIQNLMVGLFQQICADQRVDQATVPSKDMIINSLRLQGGKHIAQRLKSLRNAELGQRPSGKGSNTTAMWLFAGAALRRSLFMHFISENAMNQLGPALKTLAHMPVSKWRLLAKALEFAWRGNVEILPVRSHFHVRYAGSVYARFGLLHLEGQPILDQSLFANLPHGVVAIQILGEQSTKKFGVEMSNCLQNVAAGYSFEMRNGSSFLIRFACLAGLSAAEFRISDQNAVSLHQHHARAQQAPPSSHVKAASVIKSRLQNHLELSSKLLQASQAIKNHGLTDSDERQVRDAEFNRVLLAFRVVQQNPLVGQQDISIYKAQRNLVDDPIE